MSRIKISNNKNALPIRDSTLVLLTQEDLNVKTEFRDSFEGLIAINYELTNEYFVIGDIINSFDTIPPSLYDSFLKSLVYYDQKRPSIEKIKNLTVLVKDYPLLDRIDVHTAVISILDNKIPETYGDPLSNTYYAYRGFIMSYYEPRYKYQEIIKKLRKEGAKEHEIVMAARLIGAHLGLNQLIADGMKFSSRRREDLNLKAELQNSFEGLVAVTHQLTNERFVIDDVVNPPIANLYDRFLMSMIFYDYKEPPIEKIKDLTVLVKDYPQHDRIDVHNAAISVLHNKIPKTYGDAYYTYRGFIMSYYEPNYKYQEIINKLREEGAKEHEIIMAAKLIGAHLGLNRLVADGMKITSQMRKDINIAISEYKEYL